MNFISTATAVVGAAAVLVSLLWSFIDRRTWVIRYMIDAVTPLVRTHASASKIELTYDGKRISEPHLARLVITVRAPKAITRSRFEDQRPIVFTVDALVVEILSVAATPVSPAIPPVVIAGPRQIEFGPGNLHRRHRFNIEILTDGRPQDVESLDHLVDVDVIERDPASTERRLDLVKRMLTWLGIASVIFFIAFRPADAADVFKGFTDFFVNLFH